MESQVVTFKQANSDIADKFLPSSEGVYRNMVNCRPNNLNNQKGGVVSKIPSSLAIDNLSFGETVEYIGGCQDAKRASIIGFYKGASTLYVASYNTKTKTQEFIVKSTEINFSRRVTHSGVMDDYLFWVDGAGKPRKLNIVDAKTDTTLDRYSSGDLLIDKYPPLFPPTAVGVNDTSFGGNNITNTIFQFAYSYEYENNENSSWSPFSKSVLPESVDDEDVVWINNAIDVTLDSGDSGVKKILLATRRGEDKDWSIVDILDKDKLSIADNIDHTYRFFNDKFTEGAVQTDLLLNTFNPFHEVETMSISRDNLVIYGLVKDGLSKPEDVSLSVSYEFHTQSGRYPSYKLGAVHEFGVVFRDENGRTSGVEATAEVEIPYYADSEYRALYSNTDGLARISWSITGTPPSWAKTYSLVYLGNKTMSRFIQYKLSDIQNVGDYTYLDITRLNEYKDSGDPLNPGITHSIIGKYTFNEGDRIRFITEEATTGTGSLLANDYDTEVLGYVPEGTTSAGTVVYANTIYTNKFDWSTASIGEGSMFEIYTPKKEFKDGVYFEFGEVYEITGGSFSTPSGTITDGDVYKFGRDMNYVDKGSMVSDKTHEYPVRGLDSGVVPILEVLKSAEGLKAASDSPLSRAAAFYENETGETRYVTINGVYDFRTETDNGFTFKLRKANNNDDTVAEVFIDSFPNTDGGVVSSHSGDFNITITVDDEQYLYLYIDIPRNSHIGIEDPLVLDFGVTIRKGGRSETTLPKVESVSYSDFFDSDDHSLGRPYVEFEEDLSSKNNLVYTGKYFADTDIDETNRINPTSVKYVPYEHGEITATRVIGDTLKVFTSSKEISFYLGKEQYVDGSGEGFVLSNSAIGTINVYPADYGTENPESVLSVRRDIYYYDRKNSAIIRTSPNGQIDIGDYGKKTFLRDVSRILGAATEKEVHIGYNDENQEIIITFVADGTPITAVFNERDNSWTHELEYEDVSGNAPQGMMHYGENMLVYLGGVPYLNEGSLTVNEFFGDKKDASVEFVFNDNPIITKVMHDVRIQSTDKWQVSVVTESRHPFYQGMYTLINKDRFELFEGIYFSDVPFNLRDVNGNDSNIGYANGDQMRARYARITMTNDSDEDVQLDEVTIDYTQSTI